MKEASQNRELLNSNADWNNERGTAALFVELLTLIQFSLNLVYEKTTSRRSEVDEGVKTRGVKFEGVIEFHTNRVS